MRTQKRWVQDPSPLRFIRAFILRHADKKNIARDHSYFMGHSQNELAALARAHLRAGFVSSSSPFLISCSS